MRPKPADEKFALALSDRCESRKEWQSVVDFGIERLLENPELLMRIIVERAKKEALEMAQTQTKTPYMNVFGSVQCFAVELMQSLNLRFCIRDKRDTNPKTTTQE